MYVKLLSILRGMPDESASFIGVNSRCCDQAYLENKVDYPLRYLITTLSNSFFFLT